MMTLCWKGKNTNFKEIADFVEKHYDSAELKEFEEKLLDASYTEYEIYVHRFKENKTFYQISEEMDGMPTPYISKSLESIALAFQIYFS